MSYEMKYIVVDDGGFEIPVIFPTALNHSSVGRGANVVSAGFFVATVKDFDAEVRVYGKSHTLGGIASRPEDAELIRSALKRVTS